MNKWFTIEKIDNKTFSISEYRHWENVHSYLLLGKEKALLIDTGLGVSNIKNEIDEITTLPIIVATTHVHWDHIGGHKYFDNIAVHKLEKDWLIKFPLPLAVVKDNLLKESCDFPKDFNIDKYEIYSKKPAIILNDNDVIDLGNRKIKAIHTPGHSPGHLCFYDIACLSFYTRFFAELSFAKESSKRSSNRKHSNLPGTGHSLHSRNHHP